MEKTTQSLAGRAAILTLLPLSLAELGDASRCDTDELLLKGGFPGVWGDGKNPADVYSNYYTTYVERDLRQLVNIKEFSLFQKFISLMAGRTGTILNATALSAELGVSAVTVSHWMSVLETSYVIFKLPPYFRNIGKRITKSPKVYFYDTGLACYLMNITSVEQLAVHPLRGQLFENLAVVEFMKRNYNNGGRRQMIYYYWCPIKMASGATDAANS